MKVKRPWSQDWLIAARAYSGFCSMKWLEVFQLHLDGMLVHHRSPPINFVTRVSPTGLKPRLLATESSALTMRPPCLPHSSESNHTRNFNWVLPFQLCACPILKLLARLLPENFVLHSVQLQLVIIIIIIIVIIYYCTCNCNNSKLLSFLLQLLVKNRVYLSVKTCEVFLCFVAIVRVRVYYVDFSVFTGKCPRFLHRG